MRQNDDRLGDHHSSSLLLLLLLLLSFDAPSIFLGAMVTYNVIKSEAFHFLRTALQNVKSLSTLFSTTLC